MDIQRRKPAVRPVTEEPKEELLLSHEHVKRDEPPLAHEYILSTEEVWSAPDFQELGVSMVPPPAFDNSSKKSFLKNIFQKEEKRPNLVFLGIRRFALSFLKIITLLLLVWGVYGFCMRGSIEKSVQDGLEATKSGVNALEKQGFVEAKNSFQSAEQYFQQARQKTLYFPVWLARPFVNVPVVGRGAAGILALDAAEHLTKSAKQSVSIAESLSSLRDTDQNPSPSYLDLFNSLEVPLKQVAVELRNAEGSLSDIPSSALPEEQRMTFEILKEGVPGLAGGIESLLSQKPLVEDLLGKNGPRTYLFLFQNNQELRPTGGFIGTYGILEMRNGKKKRFFIDGIFNPDGQLKENIVPPEPIQKISAGWSLHDSNWFPDFPTSAEKAIFFYEKTGGPTVDGVFTLTPTVLERLLAITGPIELPEYEMVVDQNNFIPAIQEQVEVKYDKEENKPKKVISDLAGILLTKIFSSPDPVMMYSLGSILVDGLNEKQILLYTRHEETEKLIQKAGWSGQVEPATHDYLQVVHTNINGFKTDGIIDDRIQHKVRIGTDGKVTATTTVTRVHKGGNTPYDWWNRVNSNYMRVYVPKGSKLLSVKGQTKEFPAPPLDYTLLEFERDPTVVAEEASRIIDEETGTRISEEFDKTVFGNWVYVSPGEKVEVTYQYELPFQINPTESGKASYSLLVQKQPGTKASDFTAEVAYPASWQIVWQSNPGLQGPGESGIQVRRTLRTDDFWGVVFRQ